MTGQGSAGTVVLIGASGRSRRAIDESLREGKAVVVVRGPRSTLVAAAAAVDLATVCFMIRHGSGLLAVAVPATTCDRLRLPPVWYSDGDTLLPNQRVTVDAATGISTGISARDRLRAIRVLADPSATPDALIRPGHLIPLAVRPGTAEPGADAVALCRGTGCGDTAVITDLLSIDGAHLSPADAQEFADRHDLPVLSASVINDPTIADNTTTWRTEQ